MNRAMSQGHATRSIFGRSRVTHFIAPPCSNAQNPELSASLLAVKLVKVVEQNPASLDSLPVVIGRLHDSSYHCRGTGSLRAIEEVVLAIDIVNDFANCA